MRHIIYVFALALIGNSCARLSSQETMEGQTISTVNRWVRMYLLDQPGATITNLEQVYTGLPQRYPHTLHEAFGRYGKHAGFSNSFFEKYVFFPPGTTSALAGGEVVFMNAQPFPLNSEKGIGRYVVLKDASVRMRSLNEKTIQSMLIEEGIKPLPLGTISPPPKWERPPKDSFRTIAFNKFVSICESFGLSLDMAANLWRVVVFSPILLLVLFGLWFWRSRHRRLQDDRA